jgi:hypothetical protein
MSTALRFGRRVSLPATAQIPAIYSVGFVWNSVKLVSRLDHDASYPNERRPGVTRRRSALLVAIRTDAWQRDCRIADRDRFRIYNHEQPPDIETIMFQIRPASRRARPTAEKAMFQALAREYYTYDRAFGAENELRTLRRKRTSLSRPNSRRAEGASRPSRVQALRRAKESAYNGDA